MSVAQRGDFTSDSAYNEIMEQFNAQIETIRARENVSWVNVNGDRLQGEEGPYVVEVDQVLTTENPVDMSKLRLRDPEQFVSGGLSKNAQQWEKVLESDHPQKSLIMDWLKNGVDILKFMQPYRGPFNGKQYNSKKPPTEVLSNNPLCRKHAKFVSDKILEGIKTGAYRPWVKAGDRCHPHLVLPLTVETSKTPKLRLCIDARFVNLWMKHCPIRLDRLSDVPNYVYKSSHITKCDDKSAYHHIFLTEASREYFGFQWGDWYFTCQTLPFGWKESTYVYQTVGLAASSYFRAKGIPCSLYIDDRLNGELFTSSGPWALPARERSVEYSYKAAERAIYIVLATLVKLGYTIGIEKSCLKPTQQLKYLGFLIDSQQLAFRLLQDKKEALAKLRESILAEPGDLVEVKTLKKFKGKCDSFALAVPGAKLFTRCMNGAIRSASKSRRAPMSTPLREEVEHWEFLDEWSEVKPWLDEKHVRLSLSMEDSGQGWRCEAHWPGGNKSWQDSWSDDERFSERALVLALKKVLQSFPKDIHDCKVLVNIDVNGMPSLQLKEMENLFGLFLGPLLCQKNLQLNLDEPYSSVLTALDSKLSSRSWKKIQRKFGGTHGHTFDLMALDSNAQRDSSGNPLPHFTRRASTKSMGIDFFAQDLTDGSLPLDNPYVYPPFHMIPQVLKFMEVLNVDYTIVVPERIPRDPWWPILLNQTSRRILLGSSGDRGVILAPYRGRFQRTRCRYKLLACRITGRQNSS